jgi:transcription antitermination factor NusG
MRRMNDNPPARFPPDHPITEASGPWCVAHVKPRMEKALADDCVKRSIEYYLPLVTKVTRRKDNNKPRKSILPLFPGYLSFCGTKETFHELYRTGRIAAIIEIKHQKRFITEISQVYSLLEKGIPLEPCAISLSTGQLVQVEAGPLRGVRGTVVTMKSQQRLILSVEGLGQAMITVDAAFVKPLDELREP